MYRWLICMKNTEKLVVESNINNVTDFVFEIFPQHSSQIKISTFKLLNNETYNGLDYNFVAINSQEVSHFYLLGNENNSQ